jgi:hypothetical protein
MVMNTTGSVVSMRRSTGVPAGGATEVSGKRRQPATVVVGATVVVVVAVAVVGVVGGCRVAGEDHETAVVERALPSVPLQAIDTTPTMTAAPTACRRLIPTMYARGISAAQCGAKYPCARPRRRRTIRPW